MATATMTSKGQITVPREVREDLGLTPGTKVTFTRTADGDYVLARQRRSVLDLFGAMGRGGPAVTLDEMDDAIAAGSAESVR